MTLDKNGFVVYISSVPFMEGVCEPVLDASVSFHNPG